MNGLETGFQSTITVTLLDGGWIKPPYDPRFRPEDMDEETQEYLRERSLVENMKARRLFAHDDF
jgi:hypothetical protein